MVRKLEKFVFYLLVFSLPLQTRKFLFNFVDVGRIGNEFTSAFLYFTDLLITFLFIIIFWSWLKKRSWGSVFEGFSKADKALIFLFIVASFSLLKTEFLALGIYRLVKLAEFIFLFFYIKLYFTRYSWEKFFKVIIGSGIFQAVIAIFQYARQQDLGLRILGESPLGVDVAGVAKFIVGGEKVIRAYGTFPHPNILASFLLMALFSLLILHLKSAKRAPIFLLVTGYWLLVTGLFFTFSRIVIFLGAFAFLAFLIWSYKNLPQTRRKVIKILILLSCYCLLLSIVFFPQVKARLSLSPRDQAVTLRKQYNQTAYDLIVEKPGLGIGLGQFVPQMRNYPWPEWQLQPVHNAYLLIASEVGILGLIAFLLFLFFVLKKVFAEEVDIAKPAFSALFFALLLIMIFDHFPWTLQQGNLIFWIILGVLAANKRKV